MLNQSPSSWVSLSICSQCRFTIRSHRPMLLYTWLLMASLSYMQLLTSTRGLFQVNRLGFFRSSSWRMATL